ncbi:MAG: SDR family oxidoreductase [Hyphomicrobiaceae bacterium]
MSTLLVIGASQGIGLETVKCALAAGHDVRAFARSAAQIAIDDARLTKITGDALDVTAVAGAVTGADAVIQSLGAPKTALAVLAGTTLFSKATRILIDAMRAAGVRRLVTVTGMGAGDSRGHGGFLYDAVMFPLVLKRIYDDKDVQEQMIRASGLEWTIARPGLLTGGAATGRMRVLADRKDWQVGSITRADVADFLVREAFERRYVSQTPVLIQ